MRTLLEKKLPDIVKSMRACDKKNGIKPTKGMGGDKGLTAFGVISKNLCNAAHTDLDNSISVSLFTEENPGLADGWNFVLPNVVQKGKTALKGTVIKLFHGVCIA